jgi:hypothetical protein
MASGRIEAHGALLRFIGCTWCCKRQDWLDTLSSVLWYRTSQSERGAMLISLGNAKRERSLKRLYSIVEKNLAKVDCRTRAEFEKGLKAPDGGEFIAMSGAVFVEDHKLVEQYFERYFDELTPERKRHVAQFFALKYFGRVRI